MIALVLVISWALEFFKDSQGVLKARKEREFQDNVKDTGKFSGHGTEIIEGIRGRGRGKRKTVGTDYCVSWVQTVNE